MQTHRSTLLFTGIVAAALFFLNFSYVLQSRPSPRGAPGETIPDSVMTFFRNTCMDCHSDDGSGLAKGKLNFSRWDSYSIEKKQDKAKDICEEVKSGSMPKKGWLKSNPEMTPTARDIEKVCQWATTIRK